MKEYKTKAVIMKIRPESKREYRSVLASAKCIDQGLTHEETNSDSDCDSYHRTSDIDTIAVRSDASCLR